LFEEIEGLANISSTGKPGLRACQNYMIADELNDLYQPAIHVLREEYSFQYGYLLKPP